MTSALEHLDAAGEEGVRLKPVLTAGQRPMLQTVPPQLVRGRRQGPGLELVQGQAGQEEVLQAGGWRR
jgi:hypothetical protein